MYRKRHGAAVWADGWLVLAAATVSLCTMWQVMLVARGGGSMLPVWLSMTATVGCAVMVVRRAAAEPDMQPVARRFWGQMATALTVYGGSVALRAFGALGGVQWGVVVGLVGHALAAGIVAWALSRLPLRRQGGAQGIVRVLDVVTVLVASAVFLWHFLLRSSLHGGGDGRSATATSIIFMVAGLSGLLLTVRLTTAGTDALADAALRTLGTGLVIGSLGAPLGLLLLDRRGLDTSWLVIPLAVLLIAVAARDQLVADRTGEAQRGSRSSLLPYAAVAATDLLLMVAIALNATDRLLVGAVVVLLTGLVTARQAALFRENDRLVGRLDASLLEVRRREERFRSLVQNSSDVVTISDANDRLTYASPAVRRILGHEAEDLVGTPVSRMLHPEDAPLVANTFHDLLGRPGAVATFVVRLRHADGSWRWFEVVSANLLDDPAVRGIVNNGRDVTESRAVQNRMAYEATHDVLTGLANRALFGERLQRGLAGGPGLSVVLVDLDDFKTVNDTLGHAVGDGLLVGVADRMRATLRPQDTVARLGGDEFAIVIEGLGPDAVDGLLARLSAALLDPIPVDGHLLPVRASFGVVDGRSGADSGDLLRLADIAMYEAKRRGEGGTERYREGMEARGAQLSRLTAELLTALAENQLVLHYQPVVTLPDGRVTGVEALVRWQHPVRGLLGPAEFIPGAEESGMIVPVGRWVLREACRQMAAWSADAEAPTVAVNASARQLQEAGFAAEVAETLRDSGLPAEQLIVEITESTAVGGGATQHTLRALRAMGVRLSLDDFGTGASTLSLLVDCPVDQIKLSDRSFAPAAGQDAIAAAVSQLAHTLGVEAVAEGVETQEQADRLTGMGYELAQGYLFYRPLPAAEVGGLFAAGLAVSAAGG